MKRDLQFILIWLQECLHSISILEITEREKRKIKIETRQLINVINTYLKFLDAASSILTSPHRKREDWIHRFYLNTLLLYMRLFVPNIDNLVDRFLKLERLFAKQVNELTSGFYDQVFIVPIDHDLNISLHRYRAIFEKLGQVNFSNYRQLVDLIEAIEKPSITTSK